MYAQMWARQQARQDAIVGSPSAGEANAEAVVA
jgi:hypothetical protein